MRKEKDGSLLETNYKIPINIIIIRGDKLWVEVTFDNGTKWMPEIVDLAHVCSLIGVCEDYKYPNGEGYRYTKRFLDHVITLGLRTREEILELYDREYDPNKLKKRK